nr:MAG TPA: replication initiator protein [Caudoviricetes sp.]
MNYIQQLNAFYRIMQINPLSPNAQCLYLYLLNKNSELGWIECFSIANSIITGVIGIETRQLTRARDELADKGYIAYKKGNINNAGVYKIIEIRDESFNKVSQNLDEKLASELWTFKTNVHKRKA